MRIHGDLGWDAYPSYFRTFIPHVLALLRELDLRITFFIVGRDALRPENRAYLQEISAHGHEAANHSHNHESWLQRYSTEQIADEVLTAHRLIALATGQEPTGFRGPGFSWSPQLLEVLADRGYLFDASTLPTFIGPLARAYYFSTSRLSADERRERGDLFGSLADGRRPVRPYFWELSSGRRLLEVPVTTVPVVKTPFHLSYLLYLSGYSVWLMSFYLACAIAMCKLTRISPSFLLHPLDLIGGDKLKELSFFPGMNLSSETKARVFRRVIGALKRHYRLVDMSTHARHLIATGGLEGRTAGPARPQARRGDVTTGPIGERT